MRLRPLLWLSLGNALLALALFALHRHASELTRLYSIFHLSLLRDDSSSFMQVACDAAARHQPLYGSLFFRTGFKFIYPPSALFSCDATHALHLPLAAAINLLALLSIPLTLILDGELFLHLCPLPTRTRRWQARALIASLGILFSPLLFAVYLGQMQAFIDLLFTFAVYAFLRHRKVLAGLAVALVCVFKPPLACFVLWAILRRERRFLAAFAGALTLIQAAAIARFGWSNERDYLRVLTFLSHHGEAIAGNQSINGFLERWNQNGTHIPWTATSAYPPYQPTVYYGTVAAWALLLGFGLALPLLKKNISRSTDFLLFGLLATIASPIAWTHHYGLFYAGCIYALAVALRHHHRIPASLSISFLILANTWPMLDALATTRWNPLTSYDLYAGLILIATLLRLPFPQKTHPPLPRPSPPAPSRFATMDL